MLETLQFKDMRATFRLMAQLNFNNDELKMFFYKYGLYYILNA